MGKFDDARSVKVTKRAEFPQVGEYRWRLVDGQIFKADLGPDSKEEGDEYVRLFFEVAENRGASGDEAGTEVVQLFFIDKRGWFDLKRKQRYDFSIKDLTRIAMLVDDNQDNAPRIIEEMATGARNGLLFDVRVEPSKSNPLYKRTVWLHCAGKAESATRTPTPPPSQAEPSAPPAEEWFDFPAGDPRHGVEQYNRAGETRKVA